MSKVAIIKCSSYNDYEVKSSIIKGIDLLGGINKFIKPGEKILIKPNILVGDNPKKATTTNPAVLKSVAEILLEKKVIVSYGDSPGFGSPEQSVKSCGYHDIAQKLNIKLADFSNGKDIIYKEAIINKHFKIANSYFENDSVINLPKFKTHGLERITGAVKNQLGFIIGLNKAEFHVKYPDSYDFGKMLLDLNNYIKPRLHIMDGVIAMEGNGPRGGKPVQMNVILISEDPVALDSVMCRLINLNPEFVPTILHSAEFNSGVYKENDITLIGDDIIQFIKKDFDVVREPADHFNDSSKSKKMVGFFKKVVSRKPYIIKKKCVMCGVCIQVCPASPKALSWYKKNRRIPPVYDYNICIRCYCCQELCPESAIKLKLPLLRKIFKL